MFNVHDCAQMVTVRWSEPPSSEAPVIQRHSEGSPVLRARTGRSFGVPALKMSGGRFEVDLVAEAFEPLNHLRGLPLRVVGLLEVAGAQVRVRRRGVRQ